MSKLVKTTALLSTLAIGMPALAASQAQVEVRADVPVACAVTQVERRASQIIVSTDCNVRSYAVELFSDAPLHLRTARALDGKTRVSLGANAVDIISRRAGQHRFAIDLSAPLADDARLEIGLRAG